MANYAVIQIQGKQYKVEEGKELLVEKLTGKPEPKILLVVDDKGVRVGTPEVTGAKVDLKVVADEKGKKLHIFKFKAKSRYRKRMGFRPQVTRLQVGKLS